jgi:hypothetical protein
MSTSAAFATMREFPRGVRGNPGRAFGFPLIVEGSHPHTLNGVDRHGMTGNASTEEEMTTPLIEDRVHTEEHKVKGEHLLAKIKELVQEGNARRIIIKNDEGRSMLEIPLTVGVVTAVLMPVWVAVGAIAALAVDYTLVVEKTSELDPEC